ncbi:MAG: rhomboid family intramembrane serine protease [Candidatus Paceibacterota bacterium]|jgi:membrane associated rhomboid family serine protease
MERNVKYTLLFIGFLWFLFGIDQMLAVHLWHFGVMPRTAGGLIGIIFAPFLHLDFAHLFGNSVVLISLLFLSLSYDFAAAWKAMVIIALVSGFGAWTFGDFGCVTFGSSVFIYGLFSFLLFAGFFRPSNFSSATAALAVATLLLGALIWSFFTVVPGISWSGHFFGFVGGIVAASTLTISPSNGNLE